MPVLGDKLRMTPVPLHCLPYHLFLMGEVSAVCLLTLAGDTDVTMASKISRIPVVTVKRYSTGPAMIWFAPVSMRIQRDALPQF